MLVSVLSRLTASNLFFVNHIGLAVAVAAACVCHWAILRRERERKQKIMTRNAKDRLAHRGWVALAILGCGAVILIITMLPYHRHKMSATVKAAPTRAEQTEQANQQSTETAPKAVTVDYHIEPVLPSLKK